MPERPALPFHRAKQTVEAAEPLSKLLLGRFGLRELQNGLMHRKFPKTDTMAITVNIKYNLKWFFSLTSPIARAQQPHAARDDGMR